MSILFMIIIHIGDTRIYKLGRGIHQLTTDHTVAQREIEEGISTCEKMKKDRKRHILTRCLGTQERVKPDFYFGDICGEEKYLLCSDGFRDRISEEGIYEGLFKNKFVKYQDKTLDCITHNGISLNDIVQNSQLTLPKEVKTNKMAKATVADYVHVLRKKGVHIESYVQKNMFVDLLKQNVRDSMSKYNIVSSLPESLVSNKKAMILTKIASNKASTKA